MIAEFEAAVDALAARKVPEAEAGFQAVLTARPDDRVARRYLSEARTSRRCRTCSSSACRMPRKLRRPVAVD